MMMRPGQSITILLVVTAIAMAIVGSAVAVITTNSEAGSKSEIGTGVLYLAESGVEEALLQLLRSPSYTGETLTTSAGVATITVTGTNPKTITSTAVSATFTRKVQVVATFSGGIMSVTSWREIN